VATAARMLAPACVAASEITFIWNSDDERERNQLEKEGDLFHGMETYGPEQQPASRKLKADIAPNIQRMNRLLLFFLLFRTYVEVLLNLWLFLFPICSTTKIIFFGGGGVKEIRTTKNGTM
jgi:hypothetical protein